MQALTLNVCNYSPNRPFVFVTHLYHRYCIIGNGKWSDPGDVAGTGNKWNNMIPG